MSSLKAAMVGFDITPRFHPALGAWGTTPSMTEVDMPMLARCLCLEQDGRLLVWFGSDLIGETVPGTDALRDEVSQALDLNQEQVIWSTSQTHSSGALPGSIMSGCTICDLTRGDSAFAVAERKRFVNAYIAAGREAIERLQPVKVWAGRGYCDSVSYNTRFPMPTGGNKFSRHHAEGLQSGKAFDTTIGLVRFDDKNGNPLGAIFNFCAHPATLIMHKMASPDYVGSARACIEEALGGVPVMFCQGFCGDVNCYHIFGTPEQAHRTGERLGKAAVEALPTLIPARSEPLLFAQKTVEIKCQPMPTREEFEALRAEWQAYVDVLEYDPTNTWFCGTNLAEQFTVEQKIAAVATNMKWIDEGLRMLEAGEKPRTSLPFPLAAVRIGDVAAALSPGENFTETGMKIRARSPFVHTLVCGDTYGMFCYLATDIEIDRGGSEPDRNWKTIIHDGFRLPPAKGTADLIVNTAVELLKGLHEKH